VLVDQAFRANEIRLSGELAPQRSGTNEAAWLRVAEDAASRACLEWRIGNAKLRKRVTKF
jgi:hypothetical protein